MRKLIRRHRLTTMLDGAVITGSCALTGCSSGGSTAGAPASRSATQSISASPTPTAKNVTVSPESVSDTELGYIVTEVTPEMTDEKLPVLKASVAYDQAFWRLNITGKSADNPDSLAIDRARDDLIENPEFPRRVHRTAPIKVSIDIVEFEANRRDLAQVTTCLDLNESKAINTKGEDVTMSTDIGKYRVETTLVLNDDKKWVVKQQRTADVGTCGNNTSSASPSTATQQSTAETTSSHTGS
ncbi:hypothetical protein [Actinomyces viscosus]|uniref:hypothetical protein n=1 Tax=Actinomyces viscosus TaxID=1656 RepID=UPI0028E3C9CB|nr:hypothetical protein [Actinomyces viscosus]